MNAALSIFSQCPAQFRPSNACKTLQSPRELCEEVSARDTGRERSTRDQRRESRERAESRQAFVVSLDSTSFLKRKQSLPHFQRRSPPLKSSWALQNDLFRSHGAGRRVSESRERRKRAPTRAPKNVFFGGGIDEANFPFFLACDRLSIDAALLSKSPRDPRPLDQNFSPFRW